MSANRKMTKEQQKQIDAAVAKAKGKDKKQMSAQDSIPFQRMFKDGICRVTDNYYTKTVKFLDINYFCCYEKNPIFNLYPISLFNYEDC